MKFMLNLKRYFAALFALVLIVSASQAQHSHHDPAMSHSKGDVGVLLLAHGGQANWNEEVRRVAAEVDKKFPTEVAFGMATKRTIQDAINKLEERGASTIVAVPLFISSKSTVITSTEYLLGSGKTAPADLAKFAKMDHGSMGHAGHASSDMLSESPAFDPTTPVTHKAVIKTVPALDADPVVAKILLDHARSISKAPKKEVVVIVAHGPVDDAANDLWLKDMSQIANEMKAESSYKRIDYLTVRDDAPEPIRSRATEEFRSIVKRALDERSSVLIVPLLLSYGGIEEGVKKRLAGLDYTISPQGLLPDARIAQWVIRSVEAAH